MKKFLSLIIFSLSCISSFAAHIVGGEMIYEDISTSTGGNSKTYRITLRLFRDELCSNCAAMPQNVFIGVFNNDNNSQVSAGSTIYHDVQKSGEGIIPVADLPPCINNAPQLLYRVAEYSFTVTLPVNQKGYTATYQTCCRVNPLQNVFNASGGGGTGSTYACIIPGTDKVAADAKNSSPRFNLGISVICHDKPFSLNFSALDDDGANGDSLVYSFCEAYSGGGAQGAQNINPSPPLSPTPSQYGSVPYINGYDAAIPLGNRVSIDRRTGIISGIAPPDGKYVVSVCIDEYRNGKLIGYHRKDFIVNVADCDFAGAELPAIIPVCDTYSYTFSNQNTSPLNKTFYWEFGDGSSSTLQNPTHTYKDTGVYTVKLVINRGQPCGDSTTSSVRVFPGFFPDFSFTGICVNKPTQFTDNSRATYGTVNAWSWDFGDGNTLADTSRQRTPIYNYNQTGLKPVRLIVSTTKGCIDTITSAELTVPLNIIDKPPITLAFRDTLICNGDNLPLKASGGGNFSWTGVNVSNPNSPTPVVSPSSTTKYTVQLDDNGCINRDSVNVRVVNFVTLRARGDTTICLTDSVHLFGASDGLRFQWTPSTGLSNANSINTRAKPTTTTTYRISAFIGGCPPASEDVVVTTIPYPTVNAGPDTTICFKAETQLNASTDGSTFIWAPAATLTNANTLNPVAKPLNTTPYILSAFDTRGCPKPGKDTVIVRVLPKINPFAGRDTIVVVGQPLQLLATGGVRYEWLPPTDLSSNVIPNPVARYDGSYESIRYKVSVYNQQNCLDSAFITVRIFKTAPHIFVPTAFTPNGDGKNDIIRPVAVGISRLDYFRIYNRWGQLVFSTSISGQGWNGKIKGKDQGSNVYVWIVKGIDFTGKEIIAKGTVTLIR
ncbi:MAG: PKD domain-containing protein [Chitinophagaceae bacterium]